SLSLILRPPPRSTPFPYTTLFRSHALEAGDPLTTAKVRQYPTAHPRCGTEFLVVVIALSIVVFSLLGRQNLALMVGGRIVLIPRSEEHTSELQSLAYLVCRLLLEK